MIVLVTGHSRGIGAALARRHLAQGDEVTGFARSGLDIEFTPGQFTEHALDFSDTAALDAALKNLSPPAAGFDVVYLNAGVLGPIAAMPDISLATLHEIFDTNVWANKVLLDWCATHESAPRQIVVLSSGAAISGNYGWGGYALSKAAVNMLTRLYAHELPLSHLTALAPGLVDTAMQAEIRAVSSADFPSVGRLHDAQGTADMPDADTVAERIANALPALLDEPSGSFIDLRRFSSSRA